MAVNIQHPNITTNEKICGGRPIIIDTRTSVSSIIGYHSLGNRPEEIARQLPFLGLSQIYDAFSFYNDNQEMIDKEIDESREEFLMAQIPE